MLVYYIITTFLNIIATMLFYKQINIALLSIVPSVLFVLMLFEGFLLKSERIENGFKTAFGSNLNTEEENLILIYSSNSLLISAPFLIPFIVFFPSLFKLFSLIIFVMGFASGAIAFRLKHKNRINKRIDDEQDELEKQRKNEELGKWK